MILWENGVVIAALDGWSGVQRLRVQTSRGEVRALAYTAMCGLAQPGDAVVLNANAQWRGLGTGGDAMVVHIPGREPEWNPGSGHMMKARYTPLQMMVDSVDDPASPHHSTIARAQSVGGMPVVVADLHSSLAPIVLGVLDQRPDARIVYLLTDGAALPAWYSQALSSLRQAGLVAGCISVGQAFGGDMEAVTVHSGLLAAREVWNADVAVVIQGPGNLGTGTGWGFSGVEAGEAINAAAVLNGRPVGTLRVSEADQRARHRGLSHHSVAAYGKVALAPAELPVSQMPLAEHSIDGNSDFHALIKKQLKMLVENAAAPHRIVEVRSDGLLDVLRRSPIPLRTMGRDLDDDPMSFLYAALAGRRAAQLIDTPCEPAPGTSHDIPD
ncbi:DUF3866 family protein [Devriesea agamarum]|uniref:DUF3866 family protein n=1 Tax=Devriesea agamarum TaxID=472569 RepID=UPI000A936E28|nr:DUF3866 family protein [Devriesea agamarum]